MRANIDAKARLIDIACWDVSVIAGVLTFLRQLPDCAIEPTVIILDGGVYGLGWENGPLVLHIGFFSDGTYTFTGTNTTTDVVISGENIPCNIIGQRIRQYIMPRGVVLTTDNLG